MHVIGITEEPLSPSNAVDVPAANLNASLDINASCGGLQTYKCPSGKGDPNGYAAVVYLYAADLVLDESTQPVVTGVEGELAEAATLSGTDDLSFHAEDSGSGVYEAVATVDGVEAGRTLLDEDAGRCRDVGQTDDGLPAFLYLQPCPSSLSADLPFDTTSLADGVHRIVISVADAAGNATVALDRRVTVSNHPASSGPTPPTTPTPTPTPTPPPPTAAGSPPSVDGGAGGSGQAGAASQTASASGGANGANASSGARLTVRWTKTAKASLAGHFGRAQTVAGRLVGPTSRPIGGAAIEVFATPASQGARALALRPVRTAADGTFRKRIPGRVPSSRLTFAYSAHSGQATPDAVVALTLLVPAHLRLTVAPRSSQVGGTIRFRGSLSGEPLPRGGKQLVLEARTARGAWRQFRVVSTAGRGRYRATYRFRLAGPIDYFFRAVSPSEADFPYATGASNVVRVHER